MHRSDILKYFISQVFKINNQNDIIESVTDSASGGSNNFLFRSKASKNKWNELIHNGIKFPPEYEKKNIPLIYDQKEIILDELAEEFAFIYAKYLGSEYVSINLFNKNFFNDWKKILGQNSEIKSFELCDFSLMKKYLDDQKEKKKEERKSKQKTLDDNEIDESDISDSKYKTAMVDGKVQEVGNYRMEPPGLFIGRGKNPHLGKIKKRIYPEDITINISKNVKPPLIQESLNGHKWGKIVHDKKKEWLASWKDMITGKTKYLWLASHSDMKTTGDQHKFELARKLKKKNKCHNRRKQ